MTEFPYHQLPAIPGPVADALAALSAALPWWRRDAGARAVLDRLGAGQVTVELAAGPATWDGELLLLEGPGGARAGLGLDPVFTQLLTQRLLGDADPELPAPRALSPGEQGLARYLGAAALEAIGATSWFAGEIVPAGPALPALAPTIALDLLIMEAPATPTDSSDAVSVTAATLATPSPPVPATRVIAPAVVRVRATQPTPPSPRLRARYRLLLPAAALASPSTPTTTTTTTTTTPLSPRALARLDALPIHLLASAGVATLSPADLAALAPGDVVVLDRSRGALRAGQLELTATLTLPAAAADGLTLTLSAPPSLDEVHALMPTHSAPPALTDLPVELTAELGRITLTARAALELAPGAVVRLGRPPGPIALTAQGKPIAHGELVLIDGELGLRILSVS